MVAIINDLCMERGNSLSDAQLIVSLKAGDIGSYTTLYNRYFRLIRICIQKTLGQGAGKRSYSKFFCNTMDQAD